MSPPSTGVVASPARRRRLWGRLVAGLTAAAVLAAGLDLAAGWYFANALDQQALDAGARRAAIGSFDYSVKVLAVNPALHAIVLDVPAGADGDLVADGTWGIRARNGGYAQIGPILSPPGATVTRAFKQISGPAITTGEMVALDRQAFPGDPGAAIGEPYQNVTFTGPLGAYPAWFVPGTGSTWAVLLHGNSMQRSDVMRLMAAIAPLHLPILVPTYRNDPGAPADPSGRLSYGFNEWSDLEAAVRYALAHGAQHVVLGGLSMGGSIVMSFLYRSSLADHVSAVILDSPMLDLSRTVDFGAEQQHLPVLGAVPGQVAALAKWIATWRYDVNWEVTDYLLYTELVRAPVLLFQGTADATVPPATSAELAAARPDIVTYVVTDGAGHIDSWNLDPEGYEQHVSAFLTAHLNPAPAP